MTYTKGDYTISVEKIHGFGKKPGLWIGANNQLIKVAVFANEEKANDFVKWLDYFFGVSPEEEGAE